MSLAYLFDSNIQFQDKSGNNNVNGFLRVYIDNTDDRAVTYKDFNGTLNQADIRLDNNGRAVVIVDDSKTYRLEVYGTTGVLLWTLYPISPKATGINETLEALVAAVKSHTIAIEGLALGKKNKQQAKVISGTPTKTVKSISQNADGEITVEFEDIDFPYNTEISSPDGSIEVGTPVVDPVLKKETIPLSVANKGKVLIDENDSQQKYLEDAVKADENGLLRVRVDENEDSTPEHPNKVLVIDDSELRDEIDSNAQRIDNIAETIDELDMDSVPHAYLNSSLNHSAGDSSTTRTTIDIFACNGTPVGDCFEFEQTTTIDDTPYGYLWVEPGTYLINGSVTLQWVGNPRGTFVAKVGSVMGENFDFSQEQEILRNHTKIVTVQNRMKLAINVTYDAGTPMMGFWIQSLQVVKLAGGMSQTNIMHNDTLVGQGSVAEPLGVTPAVFDKVKDIPTSISTFRTGDVIPVDGPSGTAKMSKDDLLKESAQNALAGNLAPAFDPTRTEDNKYLAGQSVVYKGKTYTFKVDHYGAWTATDVYEEPIAETGSRYQFANFESFSSIFETLANGVFRIRDLSGGNAALVQRLAVFSISSVLVKTIQIDCDGYIEFSYGIIHRTVNSSNEYEYSTTELGIYKGSPKPIFIGRVLDENNGFYAVKKSGQNLKFLEGTAPGFVLKTLTDDLVPNITFNNSSISMLMDCIYGYSGAIPDMDKYINSLVGTYENVSIHGTEIAGQAGTKWYIKTNYSLFIHQISFDVTTERTSFEYGTVDYSGATLVTKKLGNGIGSLPVLLDCVIDNRTSVYIKILSGGSFKFTSDASVGYKLCSERGITLNGSYSFDAVAIRLKGKLDDINNVLFAKKLVVFGDSMSVWNTPKWPDLITNRNSMFLSNYAISGTMLMQRGESSIYDRICNPNSSVYVPDSALNTADYIVVFGGTNDIDRESEHLGTPDSEDPTTFYGALKQIVFTLQTRCPKSRIMFITPYRLYGKEEQSDPFIDAIRNVCAKASIPVFDSPKNSGINWTNATLRSTLCRDNLHLNANGIEFISVKYENFMRTI